ncbi:MAG TPA: bifunctional phosphoglucose/phosphomannose isomerase [Thermoplasmata archaeon]|jgi:glucose/mannose-6-phosphate isomerase
MLEPKAVERLDRGGMRAIIASLPEQLEEGIRRGLGLEIDVRGPARVFIVGMGGSGIAGDVFAAWVADRSKVPIQVLHDYRLPSYAKPGDVLIAVSYSGNTEETLAAAAEGFKLGAKLVAVTSGGQLADLAQNANAPVVGVPKGLPPRGAFGHLFGILPSLGADWVYGDLQGELARAIVHLKDLRTRFSPDVSMRHNRAKALAAKIEDRVPIVYGAPPYGPIAKRWQTQLNENAKTLAFSSAFPEADHNELVGWCSDAGARRFVPILLRDSEETPEMRRRLDATAEMISRQTKVEQVKDDDEQLLGRMLGTLYLGDYVSLYLATLRRVDPMPLPSIDELKRRLARPAKEKS